MLFLLVLLAVPGLLLAQNTTCNCDKAMELHKVNDTLQLTVRIQSLKMIDKIRSAIAAAHTEKSQIIEVARYATIREMQKHYGSAVEQTDLVPQFDAFIDSVDALLKKEEDLSLSSVKFSIGNHFHNFLSGSLPSAFLCIGLGKCRIVDSHYKACMLRHSESWHRFYGREIIGAANAISDAVYRLRTMEKVLLQLQDTLLFTNETLTESCVNQFTELTTCECSRSAMPYCWQSCVDVLNPCFEKMSREWDGRITLLTKLTKNYPDHGILRNFMRLKYNLVNSLRHMTEHKTVALAEHYVRACGTMKVAPQTTKSVLALKKPEPFVSKTEQLVKDVEKFFRVWENLPRKVCYQPPEDLSIPFCWNGSDAIRSDPDLPPITKDVRPRPMISVIEASGHPSWMADDEDFAVEGSSSGSPPDDEEPHHNSRISHHNANGEKTISRTSFSPSTTVPYPGVIINDFSAPSPDSSALPGQLLSIIAALVYVILA